MVYYLGIKKLRFVFKLLKKLKWFDQILLLIHNLAMKKLHNLKKKYEKLPNNKKLSLFFLGYWFFLILFLKADKKGLFGTDIGVVKTLKTSSLARIMFQDIGGLSTAVAVWIVSTSKSFYRWPVAILTVFTGSFTFLPYLAIRLWRVKNACFWDKR